jgi:nanoRNase/pAp phosphatase (c-di-AMP/oligoRNAs hydrolase)
MSDGNGPKMMKNPFPKSTSSAAKTKRLEQAVAASDTLGILIDADPDSMASALALKRLLWRKVKHVLIYRVNRIKRADNLTFIKLLKIEQEHIRYIKRSKITRWAIVDSQPEHRKEFAAYPFDIIIDHHPVRPTSKAGFVDIRENYGATSTIMTEYLRAARITPSTRLATALMYGIKTDTANFVRECLPNDINAFRYLHDFANMNIIKKIESSEITRKTLAKIRFAIDRLVFLDHIAFVHMGKVDNPDLLVIIADFFMRLAEARWSVVSGVCDNKLVLILRNATIRSDAGKTARKLLGRWGGSGGGHAGAARAEIPLSKIRTELNDQSDLTQFVKRNLKELI